MKKSTTSIATAVITILLTGSIIIAHDLSKDFRQLLASLTGHHWISVSMIAIILFVFSSGLLLGSTSAREFLRVYDARLWSIALIGVTLIMMVLILVELTARFLAE